MKKSLLLLVALLFVALSGWSQATINVPADYSTIQAAINAAAPNDIIQVAAGTYNESVQVTKSVIITGAGQGLSIINPVYVSGNRALSSGFCINGISNVEISGFTVQGDGTGDLMTNTGNITWAICGYNTTASDVSTNINIHHCTFTSTGYGAGFQGNVTNLNLHHCLFENINNFFALFAKQQSSSGKTIENVQFNDNEIRNCGGLGIVIINYAYTTGSIIRNVTVSRNKIHDNAAPALVNVNNEHGAIMSRHGVPNFTISDNEIYNNSNMSGINITGPTDPAIPYDNLIITGNKIGVHTGYDRAEGGYGTPYNTTSFARGIKLGSSNGYGLVKPSTYNISNNTIAVTNPLNPAADNKNLYWPGWLSNSDALTATCNYWGTTSSTDIAAEVSTNVTYIPYEVSDGGACIGGLPPVHNITQNTYYTTIQTAITAANANDVINVDAGTYPEHIIIDKAISLLGINKTTTIIDGANTGVVVTIASPDVILKGFTIRNSGTDLDYNAGLGLLGVTGCLVEDNIITANVNGIALMSSSTNNIQNNQITNSARYGIVIEKYPLIPAYSTNNTISGNTLTANARDGIYAGQDCNGNIISNNSISGATGTIESGPEACGIYLYRSDGNTVTGNTIFDNVGILPAPSSPSMDNSTGMGIQIVRSPNNTVTGNTIYGNRIGIMVRNQIPGTLFQAITGNKIYSNSLVNMFADPDAYFSIMNNWWGTAVRSTIFSKLAGYDAASNIVPGNLVPGMHYLYFEPYYVNAAMTILSNVNPANVYVNPAYSDGNAGGHIFGYDAFTTLQEGVNAAAASGTVNVAAGTYAGVVFNSGTTVTLTNTSGGVVTIVGASPALTVASGDVTVNGFNYITPTNDPTVLVTGGKLTMLNCIITESTGFAGQSAIKVTGGELAATHNTIVPGDGKGLTQTAGLANATGNYWGTTVASEVAALMSGTVNYTPWCNSDFTICHIGTPIVTTIGTPTSVSCGIYDFPVTVQEFSDVDAISLKLFYDPLVFSYNSVVLNSAISADAITNGATAGLFKLGYFGSAVSLLAPNDVLFTLRLTLLPAASNVTTNLTWSPVQSACEYSGQNGDIIYPATFVNKAWTIPARPVKNTNTGLEYCTIQAAINATPTLNTHTIEVATGTYSEHLIINKQLNVKNAALATPVVNGGGTGTVVTITANGATFDGFTIQNSGTNPATDVGIKLNSVTGCTVKNNTVQNNLQGIVQLLGSGNSITSNIVNSNIAYGIVMVAGTGSTINLNSVSGNGLDAIALDNASAGGGPATMGSTGNFIKGNTITSNRDGIFLGENCNGNQITDANQIANVTNYGIHLWKSGGNTINGNLISNSSIGIRLLSSSNNNLTANTLTSNINIGINVQSGALSSTLNLMTNNTVTGNLVGIQLQDDFGGNNYPGVVTGNTISDNDLSGNTNFGLKILDVPPADVYTAPCNWWGTNTVAGVPAEISGNVNYTPWLVTGTDIGNPGFVPLGPCAGAANLYVNDGVLDGDDIYTTAFGNDANTGTASAPFLTITQAVNTAVEGTKIWVDAGTFQEQVQIGKTLDITGVDRTKTIIKAPVTMLPFTTSSIIYPIIYAYGVGNTINISKIQVNGDGGRSYAKFEGVHYYAASGTFTLNTITGIRGTTYNGNDDVAIVANHYWDTPIDHTVSITDNLIYDYGKGGIVVNELNTHGIVTGNIVTGQNIPNILGQNGIQFGYGSYGTITGNTVTNNIWNAVEHPHQWTAAGILLVAVGSNLGVASGNATIVGDNSFGEDNILTGNEVGLSIGADAIYNYGNNFNLTINANTFSNNDIHVQQNGPVALPNALNVYDKRVDNPDQTNIVYGCIQYGIDQATSGNTLNASNGTFVENVIIHTPLTVKNATSATPVIQPTSGIAVNITADNVTLDGFTIRHATITSMADMGILLNQSDNSTIQNNLLTLNSLGIQLLDAGYNNINHNEFAYNAVGIYLEGTTDGLGHTDGGSNGPFYSLSLHNSITYNNIHNSVLISGQGGQGIYLDAACESNTIDHNTISNNDALGYYAWKASNNIITNNNISGNHVEGMQLLGSSSNTITGNTINGTFTGGNATFGMNIRCGALSSTLNIITNNKVTGSLVGIQLQDDFGGNNYPGVVTGNTITNNDLSGNINFGLKIIDAPPADVYEATCNWWGMTDNAGVSAEITGNVDFTPWLISGVDVGGNPADGFQPVPGSCMGEPIVFTCGNNVTVPPCSDQTTVNAAYAAFIASTTATGCDGVLTNNAPVNAPSICGGFVDVTWTYASSCEPNYTCTRTFTVTMAPAVVLTAPAAATEAACQTQGAIDTKFATWLGTVVSGGGCNLNVTNNATSAPSACGGSVSITWTASSSCEANVVRSSTFTVTPAPAVELTAPLPVTEAACQTQGAIDTKFAIWLGTVVSGGGCNLNVTNNATSAPSACGGSVTITWTASSSCEANVVSSSTFTVTPAPAVVLTAPIAAAEAACQTQGAIDTKFAIWLGTVVSGGGCNLNVTNNATSAPSACGGSVTITWTASSSCEANVVISSTFTVTPAPAVVLTAPIAATEAACQTQGAIDTKFAIWLGTVVSGGGCNLNVTNNATSAPSACGGSVTITWTATSSCEADVVRSSTFTVTAPATLTIACPADPNLPACASSATILAAYNTWVSGFQTSGGCNVTTNIALVPALPNLADGGQLTFNYQITSSCAPGTLNCNSTFTVNTKKNITGALTYYNTANSPLSNAIVELWQSNTLMYTATTSPGNYSFDNVCPGNYDVHLSTTTTAGGVNATDASQVNFWSVPSNSYMIEKVRFYAGDVVGSTFWINGLDAQGILLNFVNDAPFNDKPDPNWVFAKAGETISSNPSSIESYPSVTIGSDANVTANMFGLCRGDFNRSFIPGGAKAASNTLHLIADGAIYSGPNQEIDLPLDIVDASNLGAVSLILNFPSDLLEIQDVLMNGTNGDFAWTVNGNELRIGWNSLQPMSLAAAETLLTLKLKTTAAFTGTAKIEFTLAADPLNELANDEYNVIPDAVLSTFVVTASATGIQEQDFAGELTLSNHPNPFNGSTTITYTLPFDGTVTLDIYNYIGSHVKALVNESQLKGVHNVKIEDASLPAGIFMARLTVKNGNDQFVRTIKIVNNK